MKKSDLLTPIGLIGGIILLVWGMKNDAGYGMFWDFSSVLITVCGSAAALFVTIRMDDLKKFIKVLIQSFKENKSSNSEVISQFSALSKRARREGLLSLEDEISKIDDEFLKKGLQMVVDGIEPETIKEILQLEINEMGERHFNNASMFAIWGGYCPAFGMLGTLIGLIQMLASNFSDASAIASGMGKALITTFYGSFMSNLICNPIAANLQRKSALEVKEREMKLEGILAIQSGVNPRIVEEKLITYLEPTERVRYLKNNAEDSEGVA